MAINTQRYSVIITLDYEAEVFPEDPKDVKELANLEYGYALENLERDLDRIFVDNTNLTLSISPIIGE